MDGVPPGIPLDKEDFMEALERRKPKAKGTTPRKEKDEPQIATGVFNGVTTGAPLFVHFENLNVRSKDYSAFKQTPRPGHADFVAAEKFKGYNDYRGGGHFSGRLTLALVTAGVLAKKIIPNMAIQATVIQVGGSTHIAETIEEVMREGDSVGGLVECRCQGLPVGLGEPFFDALESYIAHLSFAIPAVKGIEFGSGFRAAQMRGSEHNDALIDRSGTTITNHSGGINGGLSNGNELVFRIAVKPTSSISKVQRSYNFEKEERTDLQVTGRHDACIALRVPVVLESIAAIALADLSMIHRTRSRP